MAYTEKVSLSGTALSVLLYECINSNYGQEGFFIGDITSELTNHISDSQNDNARLDTQFVIRTVLPMPAVSLFYSPSGRIRENELKQFISTSANEVVGWYKFRKHSSIKPTFRDKLIAKGLQNFFAKHYNKKTFVTCSLSNKSALFSSTHTFIYRFGKINSLDMYEYIEDVMGNLGEKVTGYKKPLPGHEHSVFNTIVKETNVQNGHINEAILHIQDAVNQRLTTEAKIAMKNEKEIKELEEVISKITKILTEKQSRELQNAYKDLLDFESVNVNIEMTNACMAALDTPIKHEIQQNSNHIEHKVLIETASTCTPALPVRLNYAAALKHNTPSTSAAVNITTKTEKMEEDLISFDDDDSSVNIKKTVTIESKVTNQDSPEY